MFEQLTSDTCPLFAEYSAKIPQDRGGATTLMGGGDPDRLLWNTLRMEPPVREVQRVNLNIYFSTPRRAEAEVVKWHQTLMTNEFIAIEEGMLTGPRIEKLVVQNDKGPSVEERGTTNPGTVTYSDHALKESRGNDRGCVFVCVWVRNMSTSPEHTACHAIDARGNPARHLLIRAQALS